MKKMLAVTGLLALGACAAPGPSQEDRIMSTCATSSAAVCNAAVSIYQAKKANDAATRAALLQYSAKMLEPPKMNFDPVQPVTSPSPAATMCRNGYTRNGAPCPW